MTLRGVLTSGLGRGAAFMGIDWVREGLHRLTGFEPYPGTLNVRLIGEDVPPWRVARARAALVLAPPTPETCGARVVLVTIGPAIPAAIVVPDVTDHPDDLVEIVSATQLRSHLRLGDGDVVTLEVR